MAWRREDDRSNMRRVLACREAALASDASWDPYHILSDPDFDVCMIATNEHTQGPRSGLVLRHVLVIASINPPHHQGIRTDRELTVGYELLGL
jgi:hypothetical protein